MKKKYLAAFLALLLFVMVLGGILLYAIHLYRGTGLAVVAEWKEAYEYNGKLLLSEDRETALLVKTLGKTEFEEIPLEHVDLTPFGFEGETFSYYRVTVEEDYGITKTFLYTPDPSYEGLWPTFNSERFVYVAKDGGKYCIHPEDGLCYPMFSDSIEGVDPYGKDVLAFSGNGSYAISLEGDTATVYHTDPMDDSLRVVDVKKVSLKEYGSSFEFGAFVGNSAAYLKGNKGMIALDCASGEIASSLLDAEGKYSEPISRLYAQRLDEKEEDEELRATWSHLLLGEERSSPKLSEFSEIDLFAVSPEGTYAVGNAKGETDEILVVSEKRAFSLTSVLKEGEKAEGVDFIYENLIFVSLRDENGNPLSRCYKICF